MTEVIVFGAMFILLFLVLPALIAAIFFPSAFQGWWSDYVRDPKTGEWFPETPDIAAQEAEERRLDRLADIEAQQQGKMLTLSQDPATGEWVRKRE